MRRAFPPEPPASGVLIVGAGPTGLTLANALAVHGTPFQIVDAKAGPDRDSKALVLNAASLCGLSLLGDEHGVGRRGIQVDRAQIWWDGRRLSRIDFRKASAQFGAFVAQPQAETERDLVAMLHARGHKVNWRTRVDEVLPSEADVQVAWTSESMRRVTGRFDYVVGCDGKHSVVRPAMGACFDERRYPMHFLLGDFKLRWRHGHGQALYHVWDDTFFIFVPLGGDSWRVVVKRDGPVPEQPLRACDITDPIAERLGGGIFDGDPTWLSRAPFYQCVADKLRAGRLLLAGDAAHLFSPIGGTGMNTGMQDALNLAWKLAHVMDGRAGDGLLDAYARQRLEAIQATAQATDQSTRVIARLHRDPAAVAPLLPRMANRRLWRGPLPRGYAGLGLRHALPALTGSGEGFAPRPAVGAMLPALSRILKSAGVLAAGQGDAARAHVLSLLGPQVELPEGALAAWQAWRTDWSAHARSLAIDGLDAGLVASSGLQPGELMLVLPCGLVAWHGRIEELPSLTATAMAVLHPAEPPPGPPSSFPPPSFSSDHQHEHIH